MSELPDSPDLLSCFQVAWVTRFARVAPDSRRDGKILLHALTYLSKYLLLLQEIKRVFLNESFLFLPYSFCRNIFRLSCAGGAECCYGERYGESGIFG